MSPAGLDPGGQGTLGSVWTDWDLGKLGAHCFVNIQDCPLLPTLLVRTAGTSCTQRDVKPATPKKRHLGFGILPFLEPGTHGPPKSHMSMLIHTSFATARLYFGLHRSGCEPVQGHGLVPVLPVSRELVVQQNVRTQAARVHPVRPPWPGSGVPGPGRATHCSQSGSPTEPSRPQV